MGSIWNSDFFPSSMLFISYLTSLLLTLKDDLVRFILRIKVLKSEEFNVICVMLDI